MSQVLIGIIGVILFIGLALAGAMFLGPRFQESNNVSKASATMSAINQVANAAHLFEMQEGYITNNVNTLVSEGYLKVRPKNPVGSASYINISGDSANPERDMVSFYLGDQDDQDAIAICTAIQRQATGTETIPDYDYPIVTAERNGCYRDIRFQGSGIFRYYAFERLR